ncbi:MAG: hypothetical protein ACJ79U_21825 [Myxococcales bacterium]
MRIASVLLALCAAASGPLRAHEGGHDVRGTVSSVDSKELTVKTSHGEEKFVLGPDTEFVKDGAPATAGDLKRDDRAVVHSKKKGGHLEAVKVEFKRGSSAKTGTPKGANPNPGGSPKP